MTGKIFLLAIGVVALSSCSVYKSGQTPDDVYYSPAKEVSEYVRVENDEDDRRSGYNNRNRSYDEYYEDYRNDRFMRLSMYNRSRWGMFDDYYWNQNLMFNSYYGYNSWTNPWNSYYYWNSFYNPYISPGFIISNPYPGKGGMMSTPSSRPTAFNHSAYVNRNYNNNNLYFNNGGNATNRISSRYNNRYNTGNSNNSESNSLRRMFNNGNSNGNRASYYNTNNNNSRTNNNYNSNNNSYTQPLSRSYTPSAGASSGGGVSSGSSSGGSISRPGRN